MLRISPTRDASPPLVLAFLGSAFVARTPNNWFCWFCLHPALFTCTTLIINALQSVGKSAFYIHTTCTRQQSLYTCLHLLALSSALLTLYLHLLALACTLSTLTCTRWHFIYTYLHSLTLCLHPLAHLLTGTNKPVFYTNLCKDISIVVFRPCLVARSLMTVRIASNGRQACRLFRLKFLSPVTGLPRCHNHLAAHTTVGRP